MTLWEIDIYSNHGHPDIAGSQVAIEAMDLGLCAEPRIAAGRSFLVQGNLTESQDLGGLGRRIDRRCSRR